ncbi:PEP/pyruvate-binding domain-containing protein [Nannocystaceae bacterium ST9]
MLALAECSDPERVGGKAANLARLIGLALPVPEGLVVEREVFDRFVALNRLDAALAEQTLALDDPASFTRAAAAMQALVDQATIPPECWSALLAAWPGEGAWIVRSSALGEDSEADSFAGQLDSVLEVRTPAQLERALRICWGSYWSARSLFYQRARGRRLRGMGVIVQRMIDPARGGVLFTRSPSDPEAIAIEYVEGHPAELVAGAVDPLRASFARDHAPPAEFAELAAIGLRLERALGGPQDVEWVIDRAGQLWIVQSRAITTSPGSPASRGPTQVFSNVNVNENYPRPISPLLYSIAGEAYEHYFRNLGRLLGVRESVLASIEHPLRHCVGVHGARLYYDLTHIHACIRAAPFGSQLAAAFDGFVGVDEEGGRAPSMKASGGETPSTTTDLIRVLVIATRSLASLPRRLPRFEARVDRWVADIDALGELASADVTIADLLARFRGFLDIRFHQWADASLADLAATLAYALLRRILARSLGPTAAQRLPQTLLLAIPDVVSSGPIEGLWALSRIARADVELRDGFTRLATRDPEALLAQIRTHDRHAEFRRAFDDYLRDWGYRISGELMLTTRSYLEQPAALLPVLAPYLELEGPSPCETTAAQAERRDRVVAEVRGRLGFGWRFAFDRALRMTQRAIGYRERARLKQALLYSRLRMLIRRLGERLHAEHRLAAPDDLLFLSWREIDDWLGGHAMFPALTGELIVLRRREHARLSEQRPPDSVRLPVGTYLEGSPIESEFDRDAEVLTGVGVAGGRAIGPARVLEDLADADQFRRGDCLVTRQTDPGWAPLFFLAKGLVMERGGMLSHGAIVAREFGIPGVIAVPDATRILRSDQAIEVDGDLGRVRRLDQEPS